MIKTSMTVDEAVCETLSQYGVEYVFGMRVYTELDTTRTRPICIHYETTAELMAYGYTRISGRPGVCGILAELEAGAQYNLGMPVTVFNNGSLLHEKKRMRGPLAEEMDFSPGIDFAMVARGLKCEGIRVERPDALRPAIERALNNKRTPTVIDVVIDHDTNFPAS